MLLSKTPPLLHRIFAVNHYDHAMAAVLVAALAMKVFVNRVA